MAVERPPEPVLVIRVAQARVEPGFALEGVYSIEIEGDVSPERAVALCNGVREALA
jgi:hypothetical protein